MNFKFRRHYAVLLILIAAIVFFALVLGGQRVIAYTTSSNSGTTDQNTYSVDGFDYSNDIELFDDSLVHSVQIIMDEAEYDQMISTYQNTGIKEYFHADIIIDGVRVYDVGIRLKGNSSLRTALGGGMGGMRGDRDMPADGQQPGFPDRGDRPEPPEGFQMPEGDFQPPIDGENFQPPEDFQMPDGGFQPPADGQDFRMPEGFQPPQGVIGGMSAQVPEGEVKIPYLIKFDEYADGQTYQGYSSIALRTYGISYDAAILQEPVTNDIVRLVGLPAAQTAYTGLQINNEAERLYVISEILDEEYLTKWFENDNGVLYKAEIGATLSYQGEDPSSYANSFSQVTREYDADLAPLIAFMRFLDVSDDATFERELPNYLDVDAFATYLAVNNLLVNTDSVAGMNNNYYLFYDDVEERFTLLMWDANESLGKLGGSTSYDLFFSSAQSMRGPGSGKNALLERFMNNTTFLALYESKLKLVYEKAFVNGALSEDVQRYSELIHSVNEQRNLVEIPSYENAVQSLLNFIEQRMQYLQSTELLGEN